MGGFLSLCITIAAIWGWIANIVKLIGMTDPFHQGMGVARAIGIIVWPLGCILGFC